MIAAMSVAAMAINIADQPNSYDQSWRSKLRAGYTRKSRRLMSSKILKAQRKAERQRRGK